MKLVNFTLIDQSEHVEKWRELGFEIDTKPRAPLIEFEKEEWTEEAILELVTNELGSIKAEGYDAILLGGLSNFTAYAWLLASRYGLQVIMAKMPRKQKAELAGYTVLLSPAVVRNWPDTRIIDKAMRDTRKHLLEGDAFKAVDKLVEAFEALEEMVVKE